ncbi:MAG: 50S ribosomal protein L3 N(5)-glutamine methyltransferase, partial [Gammaproteobacteria bacterium]
MEITLREYLYQITQQFEAAGLYYGHGTDNAWDEAMALMLHVLDSRLTSEEQKKIKNLVQRRIEERKPVAYLTHEAWFAGLKLYVDERVLIPRSPLAELIEHRFSPWIQPEHVHHILDLCTGSGCIALACAQAFPDVAIDAVDISADALDVAKINRDKYFPKVNLIQSDLFLHVGHKKYDVIISNPPYVDAQDMADLPAEYRHEPALGLAAGQDGLDLVRTILKEAANYLTPNGILIVEVGNSEE